MCCIGNEKATLGGPWYRKSPQENFFETQKISTYFLFRCLKLSRF